MTFQQIDGTLFNFTVIFYPKLSENETKIETKIGPKIRHTILKFLLLVPFQLGYLQDRGRAGKTKARLIFYPSGPLIVERSNPNGTFVEEHLHFTESSYVHKLRDNIMLLIYIGQ